MTKVAPTFTLTRYEPAHAEKLLMGGVVATEWLTMRRSHLVSLDAGDAVTLMLDGKPIACFGVLRIWPGFGEAWLILGEKAKQHVKSVYRAIKASLTFIVLAGTYHRIQCTVLETFPAGNRLATHLGFTLEHPIREAGPNKENLNLYTILIEEQPWPQQPQ